MLFGQLASSSHNVYLAYTSSVLTFFEDSVNSEYIVYCNGTTPNICY